MQSSQETIAIQSDETKTSVAKRPFLKRGSRMPVSKIPADPFTPVVSAIKNPARPARVTESAAGTHDLERPPSTLEDRPEPASASRPMSTMRRPSRSKPPLPAKLDTQWDAIAAKHADDLEAFLRDMGSEAASVTDDGPSYVSDFARKHFSRDRLDESSEPASSSTSFRRQKAAVPAVTLRTESAASVIYGEPKQTPLSGRSTPSVHESPVSSEDLRQKLKELDAQVEKFKKENEYCKKLRLERETALAEAQRYKERALKELEAAEKDIEEQRQIIMAEKRRMQADKDRGRSMVTQVRELMDENRLLKEQLSVAEGEFAGKTRKFKAEINRLNNLLGELQKERAELDMELKSSSLVLRDHQMLIEANRSRTPRDILDTSSRTCRDSVKPVLLNTSSVIEKESPVNLTASYNHPDGRVDRTFADGRREATFPSGLRKAIWPSGAAIVHFPNRDIKETSPEGVVTYKYYSTGCVQTTYPDGLEVLRFTSGQIEKHFPDGTKEIHFPNQMVKLIAPDGREELLVRE